MMCFVANEVSWSLAGYQNPFLLNIFRTHATVQEEISPAADGRSLFDFIFFNVSRNGYTDPLLTHTIWA